METSTCPFCDGDNIVPRKFADNFYQVTCEFCMAMGPMARTEYDALRVWGRRCTKKENVYEVSSDDDLLPFPG